MAAREALVRRPQWVTLPVTGGSEAYLSWVVDETRPAVEGHHRSALLLPSLCAWTLHSVANVSIWLARSCSVSGEPGSDGLRPLTAHGVGLRLCRYCELVRDVSPAVYVAAAQKCGRQVPQDDHTGLG